jgi:hypothetical protein
MTVTNKSYIHKEVKEKIKCEEFLLPFSPESFIILSPTKNLKLKYM